MRTRNCTRINHELEQRVEEKTREVMRNLNILQVSQEVLERLPVAVIGIGDDGIIAIANRSAHRLFSKDGTRPLLGEVASDVIPAELLSCVLGKRTRQGRGKLHVPSCRWTASQMLVLSHGRNFAIQGCGSCH